MLNKIDKEQWQACLEEVASRAAGGQASDLLRWNYLGEIPSNIKAIKDKNPDISVFDILKTNEKNISEVLERTARMNGLDFKSIKKRYDNAFYEYYDTREREIEDQGFPPEMVL